MIISFQKVGDDVLNNIISTCQDFNSGLQHRCNPTEKEIDTLLYFNLELAKAIIKDIDLANAKQVAKVILSFIE